MIEFDPVLVHEWLARAARRHPDKVALVCGRERWTYGMVDQSSSQLAAALVQGGVRRQDRVAVFMDNSAETVISLYGTLKAGAVSVILSGSMKGPKLRHILRDSGARVLIAHVSKARTVREALAEAGVDCLTVWVGPKTQGQAEAPGDSTDWQDLLDQGERLQTEVELPRIIDVDLAALIYTSGSTGQPKGVMSTHHNMVSAARSIIQYIGNTPEDVILDVLPLSFDYGLYQVLMTFMFGGTVVLERSFLYLHQVLGRISEEKVTGLPVVPTVMAMLLGMDDIGKYDLSTVRYVTNTGAALPSEHIRRFNELFPHVTVFSMFGLTECKRVCYLPPNELGRRTGSVGKAIPNCEVFVVDPDGNEVEPDQVGELVVRGSNVMQGYWNDAVLTGRAYREGRYPADKRLFSGDYFKRDADGFLYFQGRRDDMIKSRGERISAKEVEDVLHRLEGVKEAAVVGVPDDVLGQAIKAFVVCSSGVAVTAETVLRHCTACLENFAVPKHVEFVADLPKTANGKIDKNRLKTDGGVAATVGR